MYLKSHKIDYEDHYKHTKKYLNNCSHFFLQKNCQKRKGAGYESSESQTNEKKVAKVFLAGHLSGYEKRYHIGKTEA